MSCAGCNARVPEGEGVCPHCGLAAVVEGPLPPLVESSVNQAVAEGTHQPPFFAVSLWKLAVMSIFTLGLYDLYWFYRNWQRIRVREQRNMSPAARVFLALFFCFPCFRRIRSYGLAKGLRPAPPILLLALLWTMAKLAGGLPGPLGLVSLIGLLFLLPVQAYANRINAEDDPEHDRNGRFTQWNWLWIFIGTCLLLIDLIAASLPVSPPVTG